MGHASLDWIITDIQNCPNAGQNYWNVLKLSRNDLLNFSQVSQMPRHFFAKTIPLARDKSVEKVNFLNKDRFLFFSWKRGLGIQDNWFFILINRF